MTRTQKRAERPEETPENQSGRGAGSAVQSVDRAVSVLEILARLGEAGVTEIAEELDVHKSTAFRLLGVLENRGLVTQAKDRGKYYRGAALLRLAGAAAVRLDISQEGVPVCRELADELGETVNIAVLDDDATAPLDARLRVKGVGGLRVADGSVMPDLISVNPCITTMMIGEKCSDLLKEDA
jgi:DNA-binding IclR family transcriptional regulator